MPGSRLGPALALAAALVAVASCGDSKGDSEQQCTDACNAINDCSDVLDPCKPSEYVAACQKALDAKDAAKQKEVDCVTSTKCDQIPTKCYASSDACAGVKCQDPEQCNPTTGKCQESECVPKTVDKECTGDQFCWVAFCVDAYPRTYVITFHKVDAIETKPMSTDPWDSDLTAAPDLYARIDKNGKQVSRSATLTDTFKSDDFDAAVPGGAKLEVQINRGDRVTYGFYDEDDGVDEQVFVCSIDNSDTPEDEFPGALRTPGINCADPSGKGFSVTFDPR
jgi:hypothetical protein